MAVVEISQVPEQSCRRLVDNTKAAIAEAVLSPRAMEGLAVIVGIDLDDATLGEALVGALTGSGFTSRFIIIVPPDHARVEVMNDAASDQTKQLAQDLQSELSGIISTISSSASCAVVPGLLSAKKVYFANIKGRGPSARIEVETDQAARKMVQEVGRRVLDGARIEEAMERALSEPHRAPAIEAPITPRPPSSGGT